VTGLSADSVARLRVWPQVRASRPPPVSSRAAGLEPVEAAAVPETFFTVWTNLFDRGRCKAGDDVLIHGGTSGIGTTAIQLASALGARVYAHGGSHDKARVCERLGAARRPVNYRNRGLRRGRPPGNRGQRRRRDPRQVGGEYLDRNLQAAAMEGRIVIIRMLGRRAAISSSARCSRSG